MVELTTERLLLRRWREEDVAPMAVIDGDPQVMRYIADGRVRTPEETARAIAGFERTWDERGFGLFAVELRDTGPAGESGALVGWVGLAIPLFLPEVLPAVEIGWRLSPSYWGQGIATEAARAVLRFAFEEVGLDRVISVCHPENRPSERIMEKLGMTLERETVIPAHGRAARVLAIDNPRRTPDPQPNPGR
ncbi:GNAT family N-acetyltransferase [Streptacidiphilus sp. PAMC 29251]